jgi:uroporphyrinogen-III synthase
MTRLLVLRPEPGAIATIERARQLGLEAVSVPLFEIEPIGWEAPASTAFDGLLLTSANAVRHSGPQLDRLRSLPVYAVGEATATVAHAAGLDVIASGDDGVDGLLALIDARLTLLHLCGEEHRVPSKAHQTIVPVAVYRARATDADFGEISDMVALIHSPLAGARFSKLVDCGSRRGVSIAAISAAALESVGRDWAIAKASKFPNDEALLALAARLCNKTAAQ